MRRLLLRKARRDLKRRRSQIAAVAVTVFLGISLFAANNDASENLAASYRELYEQLDFADVWVTGGPTDELVASFGADPDVTAVTTRTSFDAPIRIGDRQLVGTVIGLPAEGAPALNRVMVLEGRGLAADDHDVALVEQHARDEFALSPGDRLAVHGEAGWHALDISGAVASAEYVWLAPSRQQVFTVPDEFAVVFVPESLARALAPEAPVQVLAGVVDHDAATAERLADDARAAGAVDAYTRDQQASNTALQSDVAGFRQLGFLFPVLFLTVAGMAAYVLLSRLVRTERPQIGMLMANGFDARAIRRHYTTHALVAVLLGAVPGIVVGALLGRWISGLYTGFLGIPITVIRFSPQTIVLSLAFAVIVTLLAGGLPARAAARIQPAEAMRPPAPAAVTKRSLVERAWPGDLPPWARMVLRNVTRSRRRFASTAIGVVLALVLIITSLGMADTVLDVFARQFDEIDRRDLTVTFEAPLDDADLAALAGRADVGAAERFVETPVVLGFGEATSDQLLQAFEPDTVTHGFAEPLPDRGIVLGETARRQLGVEVGDRVDVVMPVAGTARVADVEVTGFVDEPIPSVSYTSIDTWERLGGPPTAVAVVTLVEPERHGEIRDDLQRMPGVAAVVDQQATEAALEELMGLTYLFVGLMVAFAVVMAVALVYNMISVSLAERAGEVATLRANGVSRGFVRRTVTAEHLLTVAAGVIPGLLIGYLTATVFLSQFETESFVFDFALRGRSVGLAVALVVMSSIVAQVPGLRSLSRLDLAAVVRERSE